MTEVAQPPGLEYWVRNLPSDWNVKTFSPLKRYTYSEPSCISIPRILVYSPGPCPLRDMRRKNFPVFSSKVNKPSEQGTYIHPLAKRIWLSIWRATKEVSVVSRGTNATFSAISLNFTDFTFSTPLSKGITMQSPSVSNVTCFSDVHEKSIHTTLMVAIHTFVFIIILRYPIYYWQQN